MEEGEKKLKQEDCNEDNLGSGILTLTNRRLAFDKTKGRIMDFKKVMGETLINIPLTDVKKVWKEGLLMKKVCFTANTKDGEKTYKFGVFGTGGWLNDIQDALEGFKNQ
jgi:hypothetical protein